MAIRIRKMNGKLIALCAAEFEPKDDDIYLDDNVHHALAIKFREDFESEGIDFKNHHKPALIVLSDGTKCTGFCSKAFSDGDCLAWKKCKGCNDPPKRFK